MACDASIDDRVNRGRDELIEAAENAWALHLAVGAGWDIQSADRGEGQLRVGNFVAEHAKCNAFRVSSEYEWEGSSVEGHYPDIFPQVNGVDHQPCRLCADRGVIPCHSCRPNRAVRLERDSEMRRKSRQKAGAG